MNEDYELWLFSNNADVRLYSDYDYKFVLICFKKIICLAMESTGH